jgi:hypothetical protein
MPTYYKGGYEPKNKTKVTSAGYFIKRLGLTIYRRWGAVDLTGHTYKKFKWSKGYPVNKQNTFESVDEARAFMMSHEKRVIRHGYKKIPHIINV